MLNSVSKGAMVAPEFLISGTKELHGLSDLEGHSEGGKQYRRICFEIAFA